MILYHFLKHKKINGTLFYCFEYFVFLNKFKDTEFWLYDISPKDLEYIKSIFINKYNFDNTLLSKIKICNIRDFKQNFDKVIILDNRTYKNLNIFCKNAQILWQKTDGIGISCNNAEPSTNTTTFGAYYYQNYEISQHLQFNWEIYKNINTKSNNIFITGVSLLKKELIQILKDKQIILDYNNVLFKDPVIHHNNLFEHFNTIIYIKNPNMMDTNHRLLVECWYYHKNIIIIDDEKQDSVNIRYNELQEKGIDYFNLTKENKLIKAYLDNK